MSLFDELVDEALKTNHHLNTLRVVVEKELLHHDILSVLSTKGLLKHLTFIGGTCLRSCYGSQRLSEDLDFTGGTHFTKALLAELSQALITGLHAKYGLTVSVTDPIREEGRVNTWKIKIATHLEHKDVPTQRINIDVCAIPSYQTRPMVLLNHYGVEMGTSGLILNAESREEIFADKLVAFALRPNRLKNRDLWDIAWLHQHAVKPAFELIPLKLNDHQANPQDYLDAFMKRTRSLTDDESVAKAFWQEMTRFLPNAIVKEINHSPLFWSHLCHLMNEYVVSLTDRL